MFNNELWQKPAGGAGGGDFYTHQIANSCRFVASATSHMYRTQGTPTNVDKCTISLWVKRSKLGAAMHAFTGSGSSGTYSHISFGGTGNDPDLFYYLQNQNSPVTVELESTALYRDPSAWYHIVIAQDSTQASAGDRNKIYINGVQYTDWGAFTQYSNLNSDFLMNTSGHKIFVGSGGDSAAGAYLPYDGYIAEYVFIDGTQYDISDFGETKNGVWIPKDPSGLTFGNNGCYLKFQNSAALGDDSSGNNNDFTVSALATHDQMTDTPTFSATAGNGGNFMTYNAANTGTSGNVLAEGALQTSGSGGGTNSGTFGMISGKWYWECRAQTVGAYGPTFGIGQFGQGSTTSGQYYIITWQTSAGQMYGGGGYPTEMGTITVTSTGVTSLSSGDIMSFWLDCDNGKLWIGKNGVIPNSGNPATGANPQASWSNIPTGRYFNATCENISTGIGVLNAGQNPSFNGELTGGDVGTATDKNGFGLFKYDPSGTDFIACCAANIPTAAEVDPAQTDDNYPQELFFMSQYTGNSTNRTITTENQPDLIFNRHWNYAQDWYVVDSTRVITDNKVIITNNTDAESVLPQGNFTSVGATSVGISSGSWLNSPGTNYQMWMWRANGGTTSSNTQGDLTSTVQVDPSGGFSIVTYTGTLSGAGIETVGHGLSKAPNLIITKVLGQAGNWWVFSDGQTSWNYGMNLNNTNASADKSVNGSMSAPTSTVFDTNWTDGLNDEQGNIAYCFANTEGYIQSGTYRGNGNDDGPYIYTGFRPAMMILKEYGAADNWMLYDDRRAGYNLSSAGNAVLYPDLSNAQENDASRAIDILSNGFKLRTSNGTGNASGGNYIYLAFAQNPFQYATAR